MEWKEEELELEWMSAVLEGGENCDVLILVTLNRCWCAPPSSDDDLDDLPHSAVQLNAILIAGGMTSSSNSKHRLHVLPVRNILSVPSLVSPPPIPTERDVKSTSHSRTPPEQLGLHRVLVDGVM